MDKNKIKKIIYIIIFIIWLILTILLVTKENKYVNDLKILKDVNHVNKVINDYFINYGAYPRAEDNTLLKNSILCDLGFNDCGKIFFNFNNKIESNIYYTKIEDGFLIQFKTKKDNKYLECENKKGCNFSLDNNGVLKKY
ncbi:hypothetical protein K9L04_01830 [Patescibacteria group bacterium]|nr:hypothetical protein [Patescibacteria group bacterium]